MSVGIGGLGVGKKSPKGLYQATHGSQLFPQHSRTLLPTLGPQQSVGHQGYGVVWGKGCGLGIHWLFVLDQFVGLEGKEAVSQGRASAVGRVKAHCLSRHLLRDT